MNKPSTPAPKAPDSKPSLPGFRKFWNGGGRLLAICVPSFVLLHYMWLKLQFQEEIIPKDKQKEVTRVGPVLIDKEQNLRWIPLSEMMRSYERDDREAGK